MKVDDVLKHFGVLGMRWGHHKANRKGHLSIGFTKKRQEAYDRRDRKIIDKKIETLDKGGHLSVGFTKKRQEAYDKRDRERLNRMKNVLDGKSNKKTTSIKKSEVDNSSEDHKTKVSLKKKKTHEMSNSEIRRLNERLQLERQLKDLNPKEYQKGMKFVKEVNSAGLTILSLYAISQSPLAKQIKSAVSNTIKSM